MIREINVNLLFVILFGLFFNCNVQAQMEDIKHTITPSIGVSTMKLRIKTGLEIVSIVGGSKVSYETDVKTTPVYVLNYAYHVSNKFSLGGLLATQKASGDIWKVGFPETLSFTRRRNYLGFCPNFYFLRDERFDLYSGFRVGLVQSTTKVNSTQSQVNELSDVVFGKLLSGVRPFFGVSLFNVRVRLNPNIALQGELNLGAPNYSAVGLSISF